MRGQMAPGATRGIIENALLTAIYAALQGAALLDPGVIERDAEELFSAGQAWLALHGDLPWLLHMQYRPFCGGCTVHAASAMGLFAVLPPAWGTWKLLPLAWGIAGLLGGRALLRRHAGPAAGTAFALLWILAPRTFAELSLVAWGNHAEAGILALGAAALALGPAGPRRRLALGVWLGFGVYVSFSAGFAALACAAWVAGRERLRGLLPLLTGLPLGLAGWALQWFVAGQHPFHTIYEAHESLPDPRRLPAELWTLVAPRQLAGLLGLPAEGVGVALGLAGAAATLVAAAVAVRRRPPAAALATALLGSFLLVYGLTGFSVKVAETGVMYPGGLRYAAAAYPVLFLLLAAVAGGWWAEGRRARAALLLAPLLLSGAGYRLDQLRHLHPDRHRLGREGVDWSYLRERLSFMLPSAAHEAGARSPDRRTRDLHAYALGREAATAALRGGTALPLVADCPAGEGVGDALAAEGLDLGAAAARLAPLEAAEAGCALDRVARGDEVLDAAAPGADRAAAARERARGRTWARANAPTRPGPLALGRAVQGAETAFGVGEALGTRWGPRDTLPRPDGLAGADEAAFLDGYRRGVARAWVRGWEAPAPTLGP